MESGGRGHNRSEAIIWPHAQIPQFDSQSGDGIKWSASRCSAVIRLQRKLYSKIGAVMVSEFLLMLILPDEYLISILR